MFCGQHFFYWSGIEKDVVHTKRGECCFLKLWFQIHMGGLPVAVGLRWKLRERAGIIQNKANGLYFSGSKVSVWREDRSVSVFSWEAAFWYIMLCFGFCFFIFLASLLAILSARKFLFEESAAFWNHCHNFKNRPVMLQDFSGVKALWLMWNSLSIYFRPNAEKDCFKIQLHLFLFT